MYVTNSFRQPRQVQPLQQARQGQPLRQPLRQPRQVQPLRQPLPLQLETVKCCP